MNAYIYYIISGLPAFIRTKSDRLSDVTSKLVEKEVFVFVKKAENRKKLYNHTEAHIS